MLYLGDCLDIMPTLPAASVDLTVTSPPYDNLRTYNGSLNDWNAAKWQAIIAELYRVTKPGGVVVWVVGDATVDGSESGTSFRQALYAMECGFRLHDTMIWNKPNILPLTHNRYEQSFEYMFVWSKGAPRAWNGIKDKQNVGFGREVTGTRREHDGATKKLNGVGSKTIGEFGLRFNVWNVETAKGKKEFNHPATFPEALASDHIMSWSNFGDTVLDPFTGSGTTGKVAILHGRRFIGIERDPQYFEIAKNRIGVKHAWPWS
jgi:DNA modification methylase